MAMGWVKITTELPEKPEVWQIAGMLSIDADSVVGKLVKVWRWFDEHTENGNAVGVTYALVDHVTGVTGFGEAMELCGWLLQNGSVLQLPNFDRHNGETAKTRALTAKRVAKFKAKSNEKSNVASVTSALPRIDKNRIDIKDSSASAERAPRGIEIDTWLESIPEGQDPIPSDDPIVRYAEKAGIPLDFLDLAWDRFSETYREGNKRQKDWPATFRKCVKGNWYKLWWMSPEGTIQLTTTGMQAKKVAS